MTQYAVMDKQGKLSQSSEVNLQTGQVKPSAGVDGVEFEVISDNLSASKEFNNGDFKYRLVMEVQELDDILYGSVSVVRYPKSLPLKLRKSVAETSCINYKEITYTDLYYYGLSAEILNIKGGTEEEICKSLSQQSVAAKGLLGFFLDRPQNQVGATGWDFLVGNIIPRK